MKYILGLAVIMAIWCYYLNYRIDVLKEKNNALESEKNALLSDIQRRDENDLEKSERQKQSKELVEKDKSGFSWSYDISGSPLVLQLRKDCKSCSVTTDKLY